jgi:hypothetical protein
LEESSGLIPALLLAVAVGVAGAVVALRLDPRQLINAALFAAAAVFFRRISRIELDKSARRCRIWRLDMWRRSDRTVGFDDIMDVQVEVMRPDTSVLVHTRLKLVLSAGAIPLSAGYRANLDAHIALRESMVDVIFSGRAPPARLDPAQVLRDGGRPIAAAMRA